MYQDSPRRLVIRLLRVQALLALLIVVPAFFLIGPQAGLGAAIGGAVGLLLTLVFAIRAFAIPAEAVAQQIITAMYRAAAMKLVVAVILFALIARFAAHLFGAVMSGYIVTLVAYWIVGMRPARGRHMDEGQ